MKISGLRNLTLLDYPGRTACTVFLSGCNFRCPFCHNPDLVFQRAPKIGKEAVFELLEKRRGILEGVCVTGGEPLLYADTIDFLKEIHERGFLVKLDTNGSFPDRLGKIIDEKACDYIAMDVKSSREGYAAATGVFAYDTKRVEESIALIMASDIEYEFRTTVVDELHGIKEMEGITDMIKGAPKYFIQRFRDTGDLVGTEMKEKPFTPCSDEKTEQFRRIAEKKVGFVDVRG